MPRGPAPAYKPRCGYPPCAFRRSGHGVEAAHHDLFQPRIHQLFVPEEALPVLHPFEVGDRHAAGIGQNIRNHEDFLLRQNLVGDRRGGAVRAFAQDPAAQSVGVLRRDHVLGRGGQQHIALEEHRLLLVDRSRRPRSRRWTRSLCGAPSAPRYRDRSRCRPRRRIPRC